MAFEQFKSENSLDTVMDALYALSSSIVACTVASSVWISWWFTQWAVISLIYKCYNLYRRRESLFEFNKKTFVFFCICLALFFFALSSSLWAKDPNVAFSFSHKRMSPLAMIVVMLLIMPKRVPVKIFLQAYVIGSFLFIFNDFYSIIKNGLEHDIKFFYYDISHFKSIIIECWERHINHVYTGPTLLTAIFVIVYLVKTYKTSIFEKIIYGFYIVTVSPFMIFDCSRACILGFLISILILSLFYSKFSMKRLSIVVGGMIILFVVLMLIPSRFSDSMSELLFQHKFDDPRFCVWDCLIKEADKVPFLGYGASNQVEHYYEAFKNNGAQWCADGGLGSHNQFIGFFYEFGIIGVVLFVSVIICYIKLFVVNNKYRIITLPYITMFIVSSCFDNAMQSYYATMGLMFFPFICSVKEEKHVELHKSIYCALGFLIFAFISWCVISIYNIHEFIKSDPEVVVSDLRHFRLRKSHERQFNLPDELYDDMYYFVSNKSYTDMWYESYKNFRSLFVRTKNGGKHKLSFDYLVSKDYSGYQVKVTTERTSKFVNIECDSILQMSNPPYHTSHDLDVSKREEWLHSETIINEGEQYVRLEIPKTDAFMIHRMNGYVIIKNLKVEKQ